MEDLVSHWVLAWLAVDPDLLEHHHHRARVEFLGCRGREMVGSVVGWFMGFSDGGQFGYRSYMGCGDKGKSD